MTELNVNCPFSAKGRVQCKGSYRYTVAVWVMPPNWRVLYNFCQRITSAAGWRDMEPIGLVELFHIVELCSEQ